MVTSADGTQVQVVVPPGVVAGQQLRVQMPAGQQATAAAPAASAAAAAPAAPEGVPTPAPTPTKLPAPGVPEGPQPVAFTKQASGLPTHTVTIHGTPVKFAVKTARHIALILGHIKRELHGYALMKDAIEHTRAQKATPVVVDVGANHGLFALYAAVLGATVIAVEPQSSLCEVIRFAAGLNGEEAAARITLYNNAVLEQPELVSMSQAEVEEGAVAHVDRSAGAGSVQALPISSLAPPSLGRISFLKVRRLPSLPARNGAPAFWVPTPLLCRSMSRGLSCWRCRPRSHYLLRSASTTRWLSLGRPNAGRARRSLKQMDWRCWSDWQQRTGRSRRGWSSHTPGTMSSGRRWATRRSARSWKPLTPRVRKGLSSK